jgi:hypothetical protein
VYRAKHDMWSECRSHEIREMRKARVALPLIVTTGERRDTETVMRHSERDGWKST